MSIAKVKTLSGEIKWEVRVHEDGRGSKRLRRRFDRRIDAEDFLRDFEAKQEEEKANPFRFKTFEGRTFGGEAEYWLADGRIRFSASHLKRIEGILKEVLPRFADLPLEQFTPEFLSKYQRSEKQRGLENATVNRKTEVITSILNHSVKHRRIPFNPASGFRKLNAGEREMSFWSSEEAMSFLCAMSERYPKGSPKRWVYCVYLLALNTAMRAGEIWGVKPMDLSSDGLSLMVRRQFNRVTLDFGQTKGKKARAVPCNEVLRRELMELIGSASVKTDEPIFMNEQRRAICHDNFTDRQFAGDLKAWGGRLIRFHDLRHTATTLMIANGVDIKTVKEICGHADIGTTMNYVHLLGGSIEKVARSFVVAPDEPIRGEVLSLFGNR